MRDVITIVIPSNPRYLSVVRAVTERVGQIFEIDEKVVQDMRLAVDEACSNVIKHAYRGDTSQRIILKYSFRKEMLKIIIEDDGPTTEKESLKGRDLDDIRPGGLGIHFIKRVFDVFEIDGKKKGNRLLLVKHLCRADKKDVSTKSI
ncbi:MAG TPA: ATP-binding protein [Thermodesulfovibrionales bacterium]|nr:ATP-binding protein [Thermodesulfovibrionales bacterium]